MIQRTMSELNMDLLVFENRNQAYGAFEIRNVYNSHVKNALLIALFFSGGLFGALYFANQYATSHAIVPNIIDKPFDMIEVILEPKNTTTQAVPIIEIPKQTPIINPNVENTNYKPVDQPVVEPIGQSTSSSTLPSDALPITANANPIDNGTPSIPIEKVPENEIVDFAEKLPEFEGGLPAMKKYLGNNLHYPNAIVAQGIEGRVVLSFVVNRDGSIENVQVLRSVNKELDEEAKRVLLHMPHWTPGMQNGKTIRVKMTIPIVFKLD